MSSPPGTPAQKPPRRTHDTGFPEGFAAGLTTTLPHPDADLSPNACITSDSVGSEQSMNRRRLSILRKHRRNFSQNSVTTQATGASQQMVQGVLPIIAGVMPGASTGSTFTSGSASAAGGTRSSREGEDTPPMSPVSFTSTEPKKSSFLGKLRRSQS